MQPPPEPRDKRDFFLDADPGRIGLMVMWSDGTVSCHRDATEFLRGWCRDLGMRSITDIRRWFARRAGIAPPRRGETNRRFLDRLGAAGMVKIFDVDRHFPEFTEPPFDDAA